MREKTLEVLRLHGHGMIPTALHECLGLEWLLWDVEFDAMLLTMENDKLLILHRADGSGGTTKGEIVLVCLRPEGL